MARIGPQLDRRDFLRTSALTGAALAGVGAGLEAQAEDKPKLPRRKLGQTDLEVSVVGYGTEFMSDQGLVEHLIAEGVNNLDTAVLYQGGNAERQLAPILSKYGDDVVIATKFMRTIPVDAPKDAFLEDFNGSCERMEVEGVDIIYLHDRRTPESVNCTGAREAFEELKAAGRVKHFAMSTHLGQPACVQTGLDLGWFDVMLVHHNFLSPQPNVDALKAAVDAGVGVMTMKTCKALSAGEDWYPRATDEQRAVLGEANLFQAAIKWSLKQGYITATILCISNYEEAEEDLAAAREVMTETEARALGAFRELASASVCRGCGACDGACPRGIAVSDILRFRTYCEGYSETTAARAHYRSLAVERTAAACGDCGTCERACPYGLPIRRELRRAHDLMA